ncbi:prion-inhibition and propagation-domain-containing protein [Xylaria sp. FL1777]|nr:prion-inhibition and propagation-domain-containing protein [Xylaria sp. FL1777]
MEAAGLAIGVIGLASLFSTCLDLVESWSSYKDFGFESGSIRARFVADRVRFRRWGQLVGIVDGKRESKYHPALDDPAIQSAIGLILHNIQNIEDDAKYFAPHLGIFRDSAPPLPENSNIVPGGPIQFEKLQSTASRRDRLRWALRDKARALSLVATFDTLVQKLYDLITPSQATDGSPLAIENNQGTATASNAGGASWEHDVQKVLIDLEKQIHNEIRNELCSWLDAPDTQRTYEDCTRKRLHGTCQWILGRPEVQQWQSFSAQGSKTLWVNGPAGYGKTILSQIAYFFFSSEIEGRADPFVHAFDLIQEKWESTEGRIASRTAVKDLFSTLVDKLPPYAFFVDGLDECVVERDMADSDHTSSLHEFLSLTTEVISKSRIREGHFAELQIRPEDVKADASAFSQSIVDRKLGNKSEEQREELAHRLVHRCESMFLAIKLLEDDLRGGKNLKQLQRAIDQAPNKLDHIYDRNWERIQRLEVTSRSRAFAILKWATFAVRPLTVLEMTECLLIPDGEGDEIDYEELPDSIDEVYVRTEILELCGSLIETQAKPSSQLCNSTIHLTHFSVRQYILCQMPAHTADLISNEQLRSSNESIQNNLLAIACLRYLDCGQTWKEEQPAESNSAAIHAFRTYAGWSWHRHIKRGVSNSQGVFQLINAFFRPSNPKWELWRKQVGIYDPATPQRHYHDEAIEVANRVIYATLLGLIETVDYLAQDTWTETNYAYSTKQTALLVASSKGHVSHVEHLLEKGANANIPNKNGQSPLYVATYFGHVEAKAMMK